VWSLIERVGEHLDGEWLVIGGAAAADWFAPARTTEDIDLIGLGGTQVERFALMQFAADAGLPIEAVNSAADFFVRRVEGWRDQLVVLHRGSRATIYRPTATLFVLLKIARLSQTDLEDCLGLIAHCRATGEGIEPERLTAALDALSSTDDHMMQQRREHLRDALAAP
jgi:hypothetical protein